MHLENALWFGHPMMIIRLENEISTISTDSP